MVTEAGVAQTSSIDFDFAAPGPAGVGPRPRRPILAAADRPDLVEVSGGHRLVPLWRLRAFVEAYGLDARGRGALSSVVLQAKDIALRFVTSRVEWGDSIFACDACSQVRFDQERSWLERHGDDIAAAVPEHVLFECRCYLCVLTAAPKSPSGM